MAWSFGNNSSFIDAGAYTMRGFDSDNSGNAETAIQNFIDAIKVEIAKMEQTTVSMMNSALKGTAQQNKIATYVQNTIDELNKGMAGRSDEEQQAIKKQIATLEDLKKESDEGAKKVEEESIYAEQAATFKNTMESSIGEIQAINQELSDLKSKVESVSGNTLSEKMKNVTKNISDQDKKLEIYKNDKKE